MMVKAADVLAMKVFVDANGDTLKITDVENAQRYKIYANGELKGRVDKNG